jgi:hypothetical protein
VGSAAGHGGGLNKDVCHNDRKNGNAENIETRKHQRIGRGLWDGGDHDAHIAVVYRPRGCGLRPRFGDETCSA